MPLEDDIRKIRKLSMGAQVEKITCSICGKNDAPCEHVAVVLAGEDAAYEIGRLRSWVPRSSTREVTRNYELAAREYNTPTKSSGTLRVSRMEFDPELLAQLCTPSFVEAPRCETCQERTQGVPPHHWACINEDCEAHMRPVVVEGVHPVFEIDIEGVPGHLRFEESEDV